MSEKYSQKVQTIHPEQFSRTNSDRNISVKNDWRCIKYCIVNYRVSIFHFVDL